MNQWIDVSLHLTKQSARERRVGSSSEPPFGPGVSDNLVILLKGLPFALTEDEVRHSYVIFFCIVLRLLQLLCVIYTGRARRVDAFTKESAPCDFCVLGVVCRQNGEP